MSHELDVFIKTGKDLSEIAVELEEIMTIRFLLVHNDIGERIFRYTGLGLLIEVTDQHGFEPDGRIDFPKFPIHFSVEIADRSAPAEVWERVLYDMGYYLFYMIAWRTGCHCILLDDLQALLLESPGSAVPPPEYLKKRST